MSTPLGDVPHPPGREVSWERRRDAVVLILRGVTFHTASRVALVVGTLLTVVNQGEVLLHGEQTLATWVRIGFNYAIPFVVASIGYLVPLRRVTYAPNGEGAARPPVGGPPPEGDDEQGRPAAP